MNDVIMIVVNTPEKCKLENIWFEFFDYGGIHPQDVSVASYRAGVKKVFAVGTDIGPVLGFFGIDFIPHMDRVAP